MLVIYQNDDEVIVTTEENERAMIREYFYQGERDKKDFDRTECEETLVLTSRMHVDRSDYPEKKG